jgi:hypothetical protein
MIYFFLCWDEEADVVSKDPSPLNDKSSSLY